MSLANPPASDDMRCAPAHGAGTVFTKDGRRILDFASGNDAPFGHDLAEVGSVLHLPDSLTNERQADLATRLTEISFADHAYFTSSVEEAGELALCAMWKYQESKGRQKRQRIVTLENGFHGNSPFLGIATGDMTFARTLDSLAARFDRAAFNDLASVRAVVGAQTAGILIEPMQIKGTFEPPQNGFLTGLRSIADEYNLVLAYDESRCGIGRTGALWAHEWSGAAPDIMILGNNLAGGFPFGALLATSRIAKSLPGEARAVHPLVVLQAHATLDRLLAPGFLSTVEERSWLFEEQLAGLRRRYPAVVEAHYGMGLWQALKLRVPAASFQQKLIESGLATIKGRGDVLGLVPALTVTEAEIREAVTILAAACAGVAAVP